MKIKQGGGRLKLSYLIVKPFETAKPVKEFLRIKSKITEKK